MTKFPVIPAILLLTITSAVAYSVEESANTDPQSKPAGGSGGGAKTTLVFKKSESHQFSGSKLKGQLKKPELSYIYERKGLRQEQIVNIPENFNDEIVKGAGQF